MISLCKLSKHIVHVDKFLNLLLASEHVLEVHYRHPYHLVKLLPVYAKREAYRGLSVDLRDVALYKLVDRQVQIL